MLIYFLYIIIFLAVIFFLLNYVRKMQWDRIHINLLELADEIAGEIYRRNFLARPVFHGKYNGHELTINFSSERVGKTRSHYMDIALNKKIKSSFTISSKKWLSQQQDVPLNEYNDLVAGIADHYVIRKGNKKFFTSPMMPA